MYTVKKSFKFSAAHSLNGLPVEHPCGSLHGHNYEIIVVMKGPNLDNTGFVKDYREMYPIKDWIHNNLDHVCLNDVFNFNPTSENMAKFFFDKFREELGFSQISKIIVKETDKTEASYE